MHPCNLNRLATRAIGDVGQLIDLGEYFVPEEATPAADVDDEAEMKAYLRRCELREEFIAEMRAKRTALFAFIKRTLSDESRTQVELAADWSEIQAAKDPLRLWKRITETHVGAGSAKHSLVLRDLRAQYRVLAQGPKEELGVFKERYEDLCGRLKAVGDAELPEKDRAVELVGMLDDGRYWALKADLENSVYTGTSKYPATVAGVFALAAEYRTPQRAGQSVAAAAVTPLSTVLAALDGAGSGKEGKEAADGGRKGPGPAAGKGNEGKRSGGGGGGKKALPGHYLCRLCHAVASHWTQSCPDMELAHKLVVAAKAAKAAKEADKAEDEDGNEEETNFFDDEDEDAVVAF